jgi:hypothetical protein
MYPVYHSHMKYSSWHWLLSNWWMRLHSAVECRFLRCCWDDHLNNTRNCCVCAGFHCVHYLTSTCHSCLWSSQLQNSWRASPQLASQTTLTVTCQLYLYILKVTSRSSLWGHLSSEAWIWLSMVSTSAYCDLMWAYQGIQVTEGHMLASAVIGYDGGSRVSSCNIVRIRHTSSSSFFFFFSSSSCQQMPRKHLSLRLFVLP